MLPFLIAGAVAIYALAKKPNSGPAKPALPPTSASPVPPIAAQRVSSDEDFYSTEDYISDCADEWGMSEEQVENQLGFDD